MQSQSFKNVKKIWGEDPQTPLHLPKLSMTVQINHKKLYYNYYTSGKLLTLKFKFHVKSSDTPTPPPPTSDASLRPGPPRGWRGSGANFFQGPYFKFFSGRVRCNCFPGILYQFFIPNFCTQPKKTNILPFARKYLTHKMTGALQKFFRGSQRLGARGNLPPCPPSRRPWLRFWLDWTTCVHTTLSQFVYKLNQHSCACKPKIFRIEQRNLNEKHSNLLF